ncbi:hypothetical protein BCR42DRAFT_395207 [Absidia repens]|uniref:Uncharacterized protein n=1 Tax=Absidia repens TaxID=90262 RepID=A0A1X2I8G6_9FUNG|nr:hypothetical protein BCR42DRAFT_395207 [Absidia repens]
MVDIFGSVDPGALVLTIIAVLLGIEQALGGIAKDAMKNYNIKVLRTIQSSYDQTDLLRPLLQTNHDMSGLSVTRLCDMMISNFHISSICLWTGIKLCLFGQRSGFALIQIPCIFLSNVFHFLYSKINRHSTENPAGSWAFDLEWSELTVKMAIQELCSPGLFGDELLTVLYKVAQFKSGPLACKLPIDDNTITTTTCNDKPSLAELLVAAFALYNVDGRQVVQHHDIHVLDDLSTVTFECVDAFYPSFVTVNLAINTTLLQFSINATAQCQREDENGPSNAAYLIQYAIATDNEWLLSASMDRLDDDTSGKGVPPTQVLKNMAYAAGSAIAISHRGTAYRGVQNSQYWHWILTNFTYRDRLAWCQHHHHNNNNSNNISPRRCHCWLTHFLIMSPEAATQLYGVHAKRNIIVVDWTEDDGARVLRAVTETATAFVRLSSQAQILTNSTQFRRTNRIILAGVMQ